MNLTILSTGDIHGYIAPINYHETNQVGPGGLTRVAAYLEEIKATAGYDDMVLTVDNGDFIQGSPLTEYLHRFDPFVAPDLSRIMNRMKYNAAILGNHEFNYGRDYLELVMSKRQFPVLCANILDQDGDPYFGTPYHIFRKHNVTVAILGLTTTAVTKWEPRRHLTGLSFVSAVQTAKNYLPQLQKQADAVIIAYHGGFNDDPWSSEPDEATALTTLPGVNAMITSHHQPLASLVNNIPVTQVGCHGTSIGRLDLTIDQHLVTQAKVSLIHTDTRLPSLNPVPPSIQTAELETRSWLNQELGYLPGGAKLTDLTDAQVHGHPLIDFFNQVQSDAAAVDISGAAILSPTSQGFAEHVTMRQVLTNYPFSNSLAVLEITGADLYAALERCASYWQWHNGQLHPVAASRPNQYDLFAGIDYIFDVTKPIGKRVVALHYHHQPVNPDDRLHIVLNHYRALGGDGFSMFSANKIIKELPISMPKLIEQYFKNHPHINLSHPDLYKVTAKDLVL